MRNRDQLAALLAALLADIDRMQSEKVSLLRASGDCATDEDSALRLGREATMLGERVALAKEEIVAIVREELESGRCSVHGSIRIVGCCLKEDAA